MEKNQNLDKDIIVFLKS